MGNVVVLVGYSTSGKSSLRRKLEASYPHLQYCDTDVEIAKRSGKKHISEVYYRYVSGANTCAALDHIKTEERNIIEGIERREAPLLVVTGPAIPIREPQWSDFLKRVKPDDVVYLELTAEEAFCGLLDRSRRDSDAERSHADYGCWEGGQTRDYNASGRWELVGGEVAIPRIRNNMLKNIAAYKAAAKEPFYSGRLDHESVAYAFLLVRLARSLALA